MISKDFVLVFVLIFCGIGLSILLMAAVSLFLDSLLRYREQARRLRPPAQQLSIGEHQPPRPAESRPYRALSRAQLEEIIYSGENNVPLPAETREAIDRANWRKRLH